MTASRSEAVRVPAKIKASKHPRMLSETRALPLLSACPHMKNLKDRRHLSGVPPPSLSMPQSSAPAQPPHPVQDGPKPKGLGALLKRALCIEPTPWPEAPPPRNDGKDYREAFWGQAARTNALG
jgi:hypothetical protein